MKAIPSTKLELTAPDISAYRNGNTGIPYVTTFDSGRRGPHVMLNAITHGNEICGAIALDRFLQTDARPIRGKLTISFANVSAFEQFDPGAPHASRYVDEDFNRVWSPQVLDGPRTSVELTRAREMRPVVDQVDLLLDIHSMHDPHGPVMISGPLQKGISLARQLGMPEFIVADCGHSNGTRMRDFGGFGSRASQKNALLVECGQHWEAASAELAWQTTWRFLQVTGTIAEKHFPQVDSTCQFDQKLVRVTEAIVAKSGDFRFSPGLHGLSIVENQGGLLAYDGEEAIHAPYDNCVLIMPTMVHVKPGLTAVRIGRIE